MDPLEIRTIIFSYVITNTICLIVMALVWLRNRERFAGLGFWLAAFAFQLAAIVLIALRGILPDLLSIVAGNSLAIAGTILLYMGLERFVDKRTSQVHNYFLLAGFIAVHSYFTFVQPSLLMRTINLATGIGLLSAQCAWLMLARVAGGMQPITRGVGYVFLAFCLFSLARIGVDLAVHPGNDFFRSGIFEALAVLISQMLFVILTFGLLLAVNRRLVVDLERDLVRREHMEEALRSSEEKFERAFHASPDAILISRLRDGKLIEVNEGFTSLTEYSREEALASSSLDLHLWVNPQDREAYVRLLQADQHVSESEYDFRTKSGSLRTGLFSGELIRLGEEPHLLTVVRDVTARKRVEDHFRESQENFQRYFNMSTVGMYVTSADRHWIESNGRLRQMLGYSAEELENLTWSEITHPDDLEADLALYDQVLRNERDSYQLDKRFIRKDGSILHTTLFVTCHRHLDGTVRYLLASLVDITDRKQAEESLLRLAAIEERQRLARDLHDSVNQSIHGLLLFSETLISTLEKNNTDRARQIAGRLQESARQALKETRLMLYEMQPSGRPSGVDLIRDLETRLATVERRAGVRAQILQEGSLDLCPKAWHENLFWITIEALNNALKHAQARNMQIKICCSPEHVELEVRDDGRGFDPAKPHMGGMGLQTMRQRASMIGGELSIHSTPGEGSSVRWSAEVN